MSSKYSLISNVKDHYATLSDARSGEAHAGDYIATLGFPIAAGLAAWGCGVDLPGVSNLIAGVAILTGLLFGLVIFVFQLRLQIAQDRSSTTNATTIELINHLFRNLIYAVIVGLTYTTVALVFDAMRGDPKEVTSSVDQLGLPAVVALQEPTIGVLMSAVLVALGVHMLMILAMCLKRLASAYSKLTI